MKRWSLLLLPLALCGARLAMAEPAPNVVRAEAPVVAGNALNAKKLALANAFRQSAEQALAELLKQAEPLPSPVPPGIAQLKSSLGNGAQKYVRRYRLIEEQTEGGVFKVMVEVDIDEVLLRREIDKVLGAAAVQAQPQAKAVASVLLVAGTAAPTVTAALGPKGVRTQVDPATSEAQLLISAARQNAFALFLTLQSHTEEKVRGTSRVPVACTLAWRLFAPGAQAARGPAAARNEQEYGFADDETAARQACLERVVGALARDVVATLRTPVVSAPYVTLRLDIPDVGAVPTVLQALRRLGAVVASEVRRVTATQAEIRVFTRVGGPALLVALGRELGGKFVLAPIQPPSDVVAVKVQAADAVPASENNRVSP